MARNKLNC